ncbi:MAG: thiamine pyridinylase [Oscillospiraceae bacterium]|nr:thiamine pyridinylase [Oscillospiraceae bacterium]
MKIKRKNFYIILIIFLCLLVSLGIYKTGIFKKTSTSDPITLHVSLYKSIPHYDSFEKTVEECWNEKHPDVKLIFSDWDCYSGTLPEDLDVFVIDSISLDSLWEKGCLLALSEEDIENYNDLIPPFAEGCRVNGKIYAVPQLLCTELLYTRKNDEDLKNAASINDLFAAFDESGLLLDETTTTTMYLQALTDCKQQYMDQYPPLKAETLSPEAVDSLEKISKMHLTDPEHVPVEGDWFYYAAKFAGGMGRAYIVYSEAMDMMGESAYEMDFRLFSMTDHENIPLFYMDAAAVNAKISKEKKELALELLNMITSEDTLVRVSKNSGDPRYLLLARPSAYDTLASDYPIYQEMKKVALVPGAHVVRIKPDGIEYLEEAEKNKDLLPSITD